MQHKGPYRIALTGGGTGGHLYPGLAIAEALRQRDDIQGLLYFGDARRIDAEKVPAMGLPFVGLTVSGLPRSKNIGELLAWAWELSLATGHAMREFIRFKPHALLATGGYVSAPAALAAWLLRVPFLLHEPDAHPGLVNQLLSPMASQVTAAFEAASHRIKNKKITVTGNPIRLNFGSYSKAKALAKLGLDWSPSKKVLLVLGGSLGARSLNTCLADALVTLTESYGLGVIHQTGPKLYDETLEKLGSLRYHSDYKVRPFFEDMAAVWAAGDLVVCRAGSLTLSEVTVAGLPSILVPYPHAAANHQWHNAKAMEAQGAAFTLDDSQCQPNQLLPLIENLLNDAELYTHMSEKAKALGKADATQAVEALLMRLARKE